MHRNEIVWNMFGKAKRRKGTEFIKEVPNQEIDPRKYAMQQEQELRKQSDELKKYYQQATQAPGMVGTSSATAAMMQQLGNAYGSNTSIPSAWTTTATSSPQVVQYGTPTPIENTEFRQLVLLQVINLIVNVGPSMAKKLIKRFEIKLTNDEVDKIYTDMSKTLSNDDDPELDKVINEAVKEVKV